MAEPRTAVIIDQWELVALGIATVLGEHGFLTVATTREARTGVRAARQHRASLVVLGTLAEGSLLEGARHAARLTPRPRILALVGGADHTELGGLIAEGVDGLLVRAAGAEDLTDAVTRLSKGERYVAPALLSSLVGTVTPIEPAEPATVLSSRERDVLACLAQGRTNRQIARELFIGEETVKSHLSRIYAKLDARDRHDAVARALAAGLLG